MKSKRIALVMLAFLLVASTIHGAEPSLYDFRQARWGMSQAEVIKSEGKPPIEKNVDFVVYTGVVAGYECHIFYEFYDNKLYHGMYGFIQNHFNGIDYYSDYMKLKKLLTDKYGEPAADGEFWSNNTFKNNPNYLGSAIEAGDVTYSCTWATEITDILLLLDSNNLKVDVVLSYKSKELAPLAEKAEEEKDKIGL